MGLMFVFSLSHRSLGSRGIAPKLYCRGSILVVTGFFRLEVDFVYGGLIEIDVGATVVIVVDGSGGLVVNVGIGVLSVVDVV